MDMDLILLLASIGIIVTIALVLSLKSSKTKQASQIPINMRFDDWEAQSTDEVLKKAEYIPYADSKKE